jgi:predicted P-loop ATPase
MPVVQLRRPWLKDCLMSDGRKPRPLPVLKNALLGLREDPRLSDMLAYDEFACQPVLRRELSAGEPLSTPRPLDDKDIADIQEYLQEVGLKTLGKEVLHQALESHARDFGFHPVRDYLELLTWDQVPRLPTWLPVYAGTALTDYEKAIGPLFLISMVARIYHPGCKADHMLVLEGPQGKLKSTLLDRLAEPWFSDDLPGEIGAKDTKLHLRGKWLIEVAEMHAFSKAEATQLKSFLSRREERYRRPYDRLEVTEPRQCVFAGTTNRAAYLRDETGNRRFWPVLAVERINVDAMYRDRDQLLAEAVALFKAGAAWWPENELERALIKPQQDARYETDEWQERIAEYLKGVTEITITGVAINALGYGDKIDRLGTREQRRIANVLEVLGWIRGRRAHGGIRRWVPNASPENPSDYKTLL